MKIGSKYRNKKVTVDGIRFDSIKEANRYYDLKLLERAGEITELELQVPFVLQEGYKTEDGRTVRSIKYVADFVYVDAEGKRHIEDVKGHRTEVYKLKKKLFEKIYGRLEEI